MNRWLLLLTWLLTLALPLQGLAAAVQLMPHGGDAVATMHDVAPCHGEAHATDVMAGDMAGDMSSDPATDAAHAGCAACAACHGGAAPAPAVPEVATPAPAVTAVDVAPSPHTPFITGGPDRPPRHRLA